jgi:succinate dehydrogenase/fumarate reductase flavoprotein subunit
MRTAASATAELAAADVCARAMQAEIDAGRGTEGAVFLDATQVDAQLLKRQFSQTLALVKTLTGGDLTKTPVPVRPAVQATLGGIAVTPDGATSVSGLFAAGACANVGVRGAGELAGNPLMESVVFGRRAGTAAAAAARQARVGQVSAALVQAEERRIQALVQRDRGDDTAGKVRAALGAAMHTHAGMQRQATGLATAAAAVETLRQRAAGLGLVNKQLVFNSELLAVLELGALLQVASAILAAATARQESRGSHKRGDFPERDDAHWLHHTVTTVTPAGSKVETRPVRLTRWQPERRAY